ncbi:MAG: MarR family transcriptional regulator [Polyangiales bacterium]|nr:MarR family transcriptional regulator [Myxococcales bacterium]MCB9661660.1 MarR family transcriptional regulator [Sandaracinaceae bacterium]
MTDECIELPVPERSALHPEPLPRVELFKALVRASDRQVSETNTLCQEFGITASQYNVLRILYVNDPGIGLSCSRIGERLISRVPDITRLLDRLENAELVERCRCEGDRRIVRTRLSAKGRELVERIDAPLLALHDKLSEGLTEDEVTTLTALLTRLA